MAEGAGGGGIWVCYTYRSMAPFIYPAAAGEERKHGLISL